jgi:hypothetical protein
MADTRQDNDQYKVYKVISVGMPIDHVAIFVETNNAEAGHGYNYQVSGSIKQGMYHSHRPGPKPEDDKDSFFMSKELLGVVSKAAHDDGKFKDICNAVDPPPKQFNGPKRIDPSVPLWRCGEWVTKAIHKLREEGVLLDQSTS